VPEAVVPEAVVSEAVVPEAVVPEAVVPEAVVSEAVVPEAVVPEAVPPGRTYDAAVVGAGVIGLSCAWRLAQQSLSVLVVDPEPAGGASWMAAGMLAPVSEAQFGEESHVAPALASAARWPDFAAELAAAANTPIGYLKSGTLIVAYDQDDRDWAHELYRFQLALGLEAHWLTSRAARHREPALSPGVRAAIAVPGDHQVDNRLLLGALLAACRAAGATVVRRRARRARSCGSLRRRARRGCPPWYGPSSRAPRSTSCPGPTAAWWWAPPWKSAASTAP
jgi:hypothetical protein